MGMGERGGGSRPMKLAGALVTSKVVKIHNIFHNPPKGDRREVVPSVGNMRFGWICPDHGGFRRFRSLWLFRFILSLVDARCCFWALCLCRFRLILTMVRLRFFLDVKAPEQIWKSPKTASI